MTRIRRSGKAGTKLPALAVGLLLAFPGSALALSGDNFQVIISGGSTYQNSSVYQHPRVNQSTYYFYQKQIQLGELLTAASTFGPVRWINQHPVLAMGGVAVLSTALVIGPGVLVGMAPFGSPLAWQLSSAAGIGVTSFAGDFADWKLGEMGNKEFILKTIANFLPVLGASEGSIRSVATSLAAMAGSGLANDVETLSPVLAKYLKYGDVVGAGGGGVLSTVDAYMTDNLKLLGELPPPNLQR